MNRKKKGFIAFVTLFLLVIFALIGIAYWYSSRMNTDMLFMEAQRLKARNYAQAAVEAVKVNICNTYFRLNKRDMRLRVNNPKNSYKKEFPDGGYRVISINPVTTDIGECLNVPNLVKGRSIGFYDVWNIKTEGYTQNGATVQLETIIRVYRDDVVYR